METLDNITPAQSQKVYRFHVGLALAGIATAIICSLTLLYDSYAAGHGFGKISSPMEITAPSSDDLSIDFSQMTFAAIEQLK